MLLINKTRKTILSKNLKVARSVSDKFLGLIKKSNPRSLLFETRLGIHTFFLKDPIDVIVLSAELKVAKAKTLRPNSIYIYNPKYSLVLELPQGAITKSKTKIGDRLEFKPQL